jgi:predicted Zn-dependent protease
MVAAAACLAATACGGGAVTKKDVIARANGICITTLRAARSVPPPAGNASRAALAAYLQKVVPIVQKEAAQTRALPRPAQDRAILNRYVAAVTADANRYRTLARAASDGDLTQVTQTLSALRASRAPALAAQYGLTRCSVSAGSGVS